MYTELRERYLGKINSKLASVNKNLKYLLDVDSKFFDSIKNDVQTGGAQNQQPGAGPNNAGGQQPAQPAAGGQQPNVQVVGPPTVQLRPLAQRLAEHRAALMQKLQAYRDSIAQLKAANTQLQVNVDAVNTRITQYANAVAQLITDQNAPNPGTIQPAPGVAAVQQDVDINTAGDDDAFINQAGNLV